MDKKCENTTQVDKCWNFALNSFYLSLLFFLHITATYSLVPTQKTRAAITIIFIID